MIFNKKHIILNTEFETKEQLFTHIAKLAVSENIVSDEETLIAGFLKREAEGTTGFEDGFAIPHARIEGVKTPSLYVVRNSKKYHDWDSLDGNGVQYSIALLIPSSSGDLHMEILSSIAMKLMEEEFRNNIKQGDEEKIFSEFDNILKSINLSQNEPDITKEQSSNTKSKKFIVGISACPAGVAHTFMSKKKMQDAAKSLGYQIKWETQGANGQKDTLTSEDIKRADVVIIASDIELDLNRFIGKKLLSTDTNDAIKNGPKLIERALSDAQVMNDVNIISSDNWLTKFKKKTRSSFMGSYGVPWAYLGITACLLAIISLIGFSMYGRDWSKNGITLNINLFKLQEIAKIALTLSMPFMASSIIKKLTNTSELAAIVFIGVLIAGSPLMFTSWHSLNNYHQLSTSLIYDWDGKFNLNSQHGSNILSAIVITFLCAGVWKVMKAVKEAAKIAKIKKINNFWHPWISPLIPAGIILGFTFIFAAPLGYASSKITYALIEYANNYWWLRIIIGGTIGALIVSDMGGTINKVTLITLVGLGQYDLRLIAIISIAIPLASLGFGSTWFVYKKYFKSEDYEDGKTSFRKGLNGMTEGPLNLYNKYKWRIALPNLVATFISAGLVYMLGIYIFKGGLDIVLLGAQGHLAQANDIDFLTKLLPINKPAVLWICSILYGIVGYILCIMSGIIAYIIVSTITFSMPGGNKIFKLRNK